MVRVAKATRIDPPEWKCLNSLMRWPVVRSEQFIFGLERVSREDITDESVEGWGTVVGWATPIRIMIALLKVYNVQPQSERAIPF